MPKRSTGLFKRWSRNGQSFTWHVSKNVQGHKLRFSTGTDNRQQAEAILAHEIDQLRQQLVYGKAPEHTFDEAAARYIEENQHKKSLDRDISALDFFMPYIGDMSLHQIHQGTLTRPIKARQNKVKNNTINRDLAAVRRILTLSARLWRDEINGAPWLATVPMIPQLPTKGSTRDPYPLSWPEQHLLFRFLPPRLERMAQLAVHTGMRDQELCPLEWKWEVRLPNDRAGFILPAEITKNGVERLVVCNRVAERIVDDQRHESRRWVWPSRHASGRVFRMMNHGWRTARVKAATRYAEDIGGDAPWGFAHIRIHDLRHTFGRRLRAAGVSKEDRADLLGHHQGEITTHYSAAEIEHLIAAVDSLCERRDRPILRVVG